MKKKEIDLREKKFDLSDMTEEERGKFQEWLFEQGYEWYTSGKIIDVLVRPFISVCSDSFMRYYTSKKAFDGGTFTELSARELMGKKPKLDLKNVIVKVKGCSKKKLKEIQDAFFENGCKWYGDKKKEYIKKGVTNERNGRKNQRVAVKHRPARHYCDGRLLEKGRLLRVACIDRLRRALGTAQPEAVGHTDRRRWRCADPAGDLGDHVTL